MRVSRLLPLLVVPALLAACGGSSSSDTMSKAEYIAAADELCAEATDELEALDEPNSIDELADLGAEARAIYRQLARDLDSLGTPDEDADGAAAVLDTLDEAIDQISDLIDAAEDGDEAAAFEILAANEELSERNHELASDFGFEECGIDTDSGDTTTTPETTPTTESSPTTEPTTTTTDGQGNGQSAFGTPEDIAAEFGIDLADHPPVNSPSDDDVSMFATGINEGLDNQLTSDEAECIARFALERATVMELGTNQTLAEALGAAGTIDCLTLNRILELED